MPDAPEPIVADLRDALRDALERRGTLEAAAARRDAKAIQGPEAAR